VEVDGGGRGARSRAEHTHAHVSVRFADESKGWRRQSKECGDDDNSTCGSSDPGAMRVWRCHCVVLSSGYREWDCVDC
jgi:hypothetical protein